MKDIRWYGYKGDNRLIRAGVRVILADGLTYLITFRLDDKISVCHKRVHKNVNVSDVKTVLHSSYKDDSYKLEAYVKITPSIVYK